MPIDQLVNAAFFFGLMFGLFALISIVYPIRPIRNRKQALIGLFGCFIFLIALAPVLATTENQKDALQKETNSREIEQTLIAHKVLNRSELGQIKLSLDIEVPLVNGRLPSKRELTDLSRHLVSKERAYDRTFVLFYLPGMELGKGAFATAHHNPSLEEASFSLYSLVQYSEYEKFAHQ